jgi:hypothetical protein
MRRVIIHNYIPTGRGVPNTRSLGKGSRLVAKAHDHGADCHCGDQCDKCRQGLRDRFQRTNSSKDLSGYEKTALGIDVTYSKGPMGHDKQTEARHYVVPGFKIDPRGEGPGPAAVAAELRRHPEHIGMIRDGWVVDKAEGYYKQALKDRDRGDLI